MWWHHVPATFTSPPQRVPVPQVWLRSRSGTWCSGLKTAGPDHCGIEAVPRLEVVGAHFGFSTITAEHNRENFPRHIRRMIYLCVATRSQRP